MLNSTATITGFEVTLIGLYIGFSHFIFIAVCLHNWGIKGICISIYSCAPRTEVYFALCHLNSFLKSRSLEVVQPTILTYPTTHSVERERARKNKWRLFSTPTSNYTSHICNEIHAGLDRNTKYSASFQNFYLALESTQIIYFWLCSRK
jgi:hypothetical protein